MLPTRVRAAAVIGITNQSSGKPTDNVHPDDQPAPRSPRVTTVTSDEKDEPLKLSNSTQDAIRALEELDLSHILFSHRDCLRQLALELSTMGEGSMGVIRAIEHRIDLLPNIKPFLHLFYRAGPKAMEEEATQVERMLQTGVIEPAQSPWASPVVLVLKADG